MSWKDTVGLSESTGKVQVYCPKDAKEQWKQETQDHGYKSMSAYLFELIQEARAYRADGFLAHHESEQQIEELKQEVERLEQQLEKKEQRDSGHVQIDDPEFLYRFIDTQHKTLDEILKAIVESGALNELIRKPVEDQLYFLAAQDRLEYKHGHGWKLTGGDQ